VITVEEIRANRARISAPICGWLSLTSKYDDKIIRPLNSKIGGKVYVYTTDTKGIPATYCTEIIDYSVTSALYQIQYKDEPYLGKTQWIDLRSPACYYVPKQRPQPVCLESIDSDKQSEREQFLHGFFAADYPEFKPRADTQSNAPTSTAYGQNHAMMNGPQQQQQRVNHANYAPNYYYQYQQQMQRQQQQQQQAASDHRATGMNVMNGTGSNKHHNVRCQTRLNEHDAANTNVQTVTVVKADNVKNTKEPKECTQTQTQTQANAAKSATAAALKKRAEQKRAQYIRGKLKQIEARIVHHLHDKGYTAEHPEYARYLEKAKQCALKKAFEQQQMQTLTNK